MHKVQHRLKNATDEKNAAEAQSLAEELYTAKAQTEADVPNAVEAIITVGAPRAT